MLVLGVLAFLYGKAFAVTGLGEGGGIQGCYKGRIDHGRKAREGRFG